MKRNFTKLLAALALLAFFMPAMTGWGQTRADYTIAFKSNSGDDSSTELTETTALNALDEGSAYVTSISSISKVYKGKNGYGWKLGSSRAVGKFVINLSNSGQVTANKITVKTAKYSNDTGKVKITLNGSTNSNYIHQITPETSLADDEWTLTTATALTSIQIETTTKRAYVYSVVVSYETGETSTYTVTAAKETGVSTAYVAAGSTFSGTATSVSVEEGGSATFQATVDSGYTFDGWYNGNTLVSNSTTYTVNNITSVLTLTAKATASGDENYCDYVLVTESQPDWSGDYVLVYNESASSAKVLSGQGGTNKPYGTAIDATVSNNALAYNDVSNYNITIERVTYNNQTYYTLKQGDYYLGCTDNSNNVLNFAQTVTGDNWKYYYWSIDYSGSTLTITNCNYTSRKIKWNNSSPRFACYTSAQTDISLYMKEDCGPTATITVSASPAEGGTVSHTGGEWSGNEGVYDKNDECTLTAVPNACYSFVNWTKNGVEVSTDASYTFTVTRNVDLVANFELPVPSNLSATTTATSATLTWTGEQGSYNVALGVDGDVVTLVNEDFSSSIPLDWTNNSANPWTIVDGYMQSGNAGVSSSTSEISVVKTFDTNGTIEFDAECMGEGTSSYYDHCDFYIDNVQKINAGANISGWNHYSYNVTAGQHTFKWSYSKDSSVNPDGDYFAVDNVIMSCQGIDWDTPVAVQTEEYTFTNLTPSTKYYARVQGVCNGTAMEWSDISTFTTAAGYMVSVSSNNSTMGSASITYNGETVASPAEITPGDQVKVTATSNAGYAFVNWTENGEEVSTDEEYTFTVNADHTLTANFEESKHWLTIVTQPAGAGTVTVNVNGVDYTDSQVEVGQNRTATLSIAPNSGYTVSDCLVTTGADAGSSVTLQADNVTAEFTMGSADATVTVVFNIPQQDISFDVIGYEEGDGRWYLFTSPLADATSPAAVTNLFADGGDAESEYYDLYRFDQTQVLEWRNYKQEPFDLVAGTGYLYANDGTSVLYFHGTPYDGDGVIEITNEAGHNWSGYNLVGNPYNAEAWSSLPYYAMNGVGTDIIACDETSRSLGKMEGFFVHTDDAESTVTVSTTNPNAKSASLTLNVSRGRGLLDRAIVSFGNNNTLPKFQLNPSHTKVYIPREDRDYAIVTAEAEMGEMPVSFKAEKSGSYTISVTAEGVSFGYLHLIDNKTGNDVDLLQTSSYTFNALDTDYASRFKLVFATGNATGDSFAFYSNGSWVISNEGEATLQVIDVTGRVLRSERVSGCTSVGMSAAPGVYMLRLVNGDNVRVQKVVVR